MLKVYPDAPHNDYVSTRARLATGMRRTRRNGGVDCRLGDCCQCGTAAESNGDTNRASKRGRSRHAADHARLDVDRGRRRHR